MYTLRGGVSTNQKHKVYHRRPNLSTPSRFVRLLCLVFTKQIRRKNSRHFHLHDELQPTLFSGVSGMMSRTQDNMTFNIYICIGRYPRFYYSIFCLYCVLLIFMCVSQYYRFHTFMFYMMLHAITLAVYTSKVYQKSLLFFLLFLLCEVFMPLMAFLRR